MSTASFSFHAASRGQRLRAGIARLKTPRGLVPVGIMVVFPFVVFLAPSVGGPMDCAMMPWALLLAVIGASLTTCMVIAAPMFGRFVPSVITFDDTGIHEAVAGRVVDRGWDWLLSVVDEPRTVTLFCGASKSFQLQHAEQGQGANADPREGRSADRGDA